MLLGVLSLLVGLLSGCNPPFWCCQPEKVDTLSDVTISNGDDITFVLVADPQFNNESDEKEDQRDGSRRVADRINKIKNGGCVFTWPTGTTSAGQNVSAPIAVVMAGDLTQFASCCELTQYKKIWHPEDGTIEYPVYPGLGNHDYEHDRTRMQKYTERLMKDHAKVVNFHSESKNYSWNWGNFHFIQLNRWAGAHEGGLDWLKDDLRSNAGAAKPVVIIQHYGYDNFSKESRWWSDTDREEFENILCNRSNSSDPCNRYNIAAILTGHSHSFSNHTITSVDTENYVSTHARTASNPSGFLVVRLTNTFIDVAQYAVDQNSCGNFIQGYTRTL